MTSLQTLIRAIGSILNILIPILAAAALLVFFWGLVKFILKLGGDAKAVEEGRNKMVWGLISLFIIVSLWGIIYFFQRQLGLQGVDWATLPSSNPSPRDITSPPPGNSFGRPSSDFDDLPSSNPINLYPSPVP